MSPQYHTSRTVLLSVEQTCYRNNILHSYLLWTFDLNSCAMIHSFTNALLNLSCGKHGKILYKDQLFTHKLSKRSSKPKSNKKKSTTIFQCEDIQYSYTFRVNRYSIHYIICIFGVKKYNHSFVLWVWCWRVEVEAQLFLMGHCL